MDKFSKLLSKALVVVYAVGMFSPIATNVQAETINVEVKGVYADVPTNSPFGMYVEFLFHQGVISPNKNFSPDALVTRGQASKMIVKAFNLTEDTSGAEFPDVPATDTFYKEIMTLKNKGIVNGYKDGKFYGNNKVTRGALLKMAVNAAKSQKPSLFPESDIDLEKIFSDTPNNHSFALFIKSAYKVGQDDPNEVTKVIKGFSDGTFRPDIEMTRAAVAKVLANIMKYGDFSNISCEEYYCQDKFVAPLGTEVYDGTNFKVTYTSDWQDGFTGSSDFAEQTDEGEALLLSKGNTIVAMFTATDLSSSQPEGTQFGDLINIKGFGDLITEQFKEGTSVSGEDLGTEFTVISNGLRTDSIYRIQIEVNEGLNDNPDENSYGYFEFALKGNMMFMNGAFSENEADLPMLDQALKGFEVK